MSAVLCSCGCSLEAPHEQALLSCPGRENLFRRHLAPAPTDEQAHGIVVEEYSP
jgi:hypothetical protein